MEVRLHIYPQRTKPFWIKSCRSYVIAICFLSCFMLFMLMPNTMYLIVAPCVFCCHFRSLFLFVLPIQSKTKLTPTQFRDTHKWKHMITNLIILTHTHTQDGVFVRSSRFPYRLSHTNKDDKKAFTLSHTTHDTKTKVVIGRKSNILLVLLRNIICCLWYETSLMVVAVAASDETKLRECIW